MAIENGNDWSVSRYVAQQRFDVRAAGRDEESPASSSSHRVRGAAPRAPAVVQEIWARDLEVRNRAGVAVEVLLNEALHSGVRLWRDNAAMRDDNASPSVRRHKLQIIRAAIFRTTEPDPPAENR